MMKKNILIKDYIYSNKNTNIYKHEVPSTREWTNSVYSYDKNYIKNLPQKDNYLYNLIKTYLHIVPNIKFSTKSRRLRNSLTRNSSKQIFISKPEIKQNSDRINIMLYLYNRETKIKNKRAFRFNNILKTIINKITYANHTKILYKKKYVRRINLKKRLYKRYDPYNNKYNKNIYNSVVNNNSIINNLFIYRFLTFTLSRFGFHVYTVKNHNDKYMHLLVTKVINNKRVYSKYYLFNDNKVTAINLPFINRILITYVYILYNSNMNEISRLFRKFKKQFSEKFMKKSVRKQRIAVRNAFRLHTNKVKFGRIIMGLKLLVNNIYNKKVELNIVNLKYLHLNSDILTEAIGVKLRRKNNGVLSIFKKALSLVKIPKLNSNKNMFSTMNLIDKFRTFNANNVINNKFLDYTTFIRNKDTLSVILRSIFPYKFLNFTYKYSNLSISNLLNSLYYRWVTGIRLEGKGRLTKRFTASRSMFKYRYRGSLKNLEHLNVPFYKKDTLNSMMIRNQYRSNIQYSLTSNKKRVGVYGIKGWISNN